MTSPGQVKNVIKQKKKGIENRRKCVSGGGVRGGYLGSLIRPIIIERGQWGKCLELKETSMTQRARS